MSCFLNLKPITSCTQKKVPDEFKIIEQYISDIIGLEHKLVDFDSLEVQQKGLDYIYLEKTISFWFKQYCIVPFSLPKPKYVREVMNIDLDIWLNMNFVSDYYYDYGIVIIPNYDVEFAKYLETKCDILTKFFEENIIQFERYQNSLEKSYNDNIVKSKIGWFNFNYGPLLRKELISFSNDDYEFLKIRVKDLHPLFF